MIAQDFKIQLTERLKELHLPVLRRCFEEKARQAERETTGYERYLFELIELECQERFGAWQEFPISVPLNLPTLGTRLGIRMGTRSVSVIHAHACLVVSWWV